MNRCVFFALNQIAWLVQHHISPEWVQDKKCCRVITYLSQKQLSSVTVNWFGPESPKSCSIFTNLIKTIFLTRTIICFLSDESAVRLSRPLSFIGVRWAFFISWVGNSDFVNYASGFLFINWLRSIIKTITQDRFIKPQEKQMFKILARAVQRNRSEE